ALRCSESGRVETVSEYGSGWCPFCFIINLVRLYLELFEMNPGYFKDLCLYIPESKNDLPDIVDEALFGLDIYRRMQTPEGGIRGGVESSEHPIEGSTSWQETQTALAYAPDHWSSYLYIGVAARAAYVLKMLGKGEEAKKWEESAIKAMEWAEVEYEKWISAPEYAQVRERAKNTVPIERNLAAVELYRLTKNKRWHEVYLSTQNLETERTEASFIYARLDEKLVDKKARQNAVNALISVANRLVEISANNAFGLTTGSPGRPNGAYSSAYTIPAEPTLVRAHYFSGDSKYLKTMLRSTLYVAGANPMNLSLTTGLGENYIQKPLHEDSQHTGRPAPLGITVFGPFELTDSYARAGSPMEKRINANLNPEISEWPTSESFFDVFWIVPMNEYVIGRPLGQAAYIWGYLASRK
ncbi:MAG: glycoside hydrolase family 9 protein, partial [Mariniphaga sp.]|nr:glycoside hydrolase family 9 protein [Mariniphaga sp.]